MRILVADDDRVSRAILIRTLEGWKFEVVTADDGDSALATLQGQAPSMAILDWMMPGLAGPQICQRIRQDAALAGMYVLLLSGRDSRADLVTGLDAGADDYITKPFNPDELHARINVGMRVLALQERLAEQVAELQKAFANVRQLQGLLPICSYCKAVRSDNDYWERIDTYITQHSDTQFSHGICPNCMDRALKDMDIPESEAPPAAKRGLFGRWR